MAYQTALLALGNATRCLIFECLRGGPITVGEIARKIPVTRPAVSQHLKVLKEAGLVDDWVSGVRHFYQVDERGLEEIRAWLGLFTRARKGSGETLSWPLSAVDPKRTLHRWSAAGSSSPVRGQKEITAPNSSKTKKHATS